MHLSYLTMIIKQTIKQENNTQSKDESFDAYEKEYNRLEVSREDTETIWEDRTYQIAAGGLSLSFTVFSFLMGREGGLAFSWQISVIWAVFAACLIINYLSQRISAKRFVKLQQDLYKDRNNKVSYDEDTIMKRNQESDRLPNFLNCLTECLLVANIVFTIIYICILFCK